HNPFEIRCCGSAHCVVAGCAPPTGLAARDALVHYPLGRGLALVGEAVGEQEITTALRGAADQKARLDRAKFLVRFDPRAEVATADLAQRHCVRFGRWRASYCVAVSYALCG